MNQSNVYNISPLADHADVSNQVGIDGRSGVILEELGFCVHLNLRCDASDFQALAVASNTFGVGLPLVPNTFHEAFDIKIHWLGPDEWLVLAPMTHIHLFQKINLVWSRFHHSVTDITGGQAVMRIEGERACEVLNQGCTLDLHHRVFQAGHCAQSLLAHVPVLISRNSNNANSICQFDLVVRRSYADYLARWLLDAAREIGFVNRLGNVRQSIAPTNRSKMSSESE